MENRRRQQLGSILLLMALISGPQILSAQDVQDEPDLAREARFHQIYKKYNEEPTPEERWQSAVSAATAQTYTVQTGDTLWSLSETFFGDSNFWPKVWSINNVNIENPHLILPSQLVQFTPGTLGEAPSLTVTDGVPGEATDTSSTTSAAQATTQTSSGGFNLPPPGAKSRKLSGLPDSLPPWQFAQDRRNDMELEVTPLNRNFGNPPQMLSYYATDDDTAVMGRVTETEMAMSSASDFQYVYVRLPEGGSGGNYLVVKDVDTVKDPYSGKVADLMQVQGEIQVLEKVNSDQNIFRAIVQKSVNPVTVGASLVAGDIPAYNSRDEGSPGTAAMRVVGGAFSKDRKLFGPESIVVLNGGTSEGVAPGQTYPIFKQQPLRNEETRSYENSRQIGTAKIIRVSPGFATAVIINAVDDIRIGDTTSSNVR